MNRLVCLACLVVGFQNGNAIADQPFDLKAELAKPVFDPGTPLDEVQRYLEQRIPRIPAVKTAAEWESLASKWRDHPLSVEYVGEPLRGPGYVVKKLRYECLPGLWIPALLYVPEMLLDEQSAKETGKVPVVLNVNGHDAAGKAAEYKQTRCINLVKRGMMRRSLIHD